MVCTRLLATIHKAGVEFRLFVCCFFFGGGGGQGRGKSCRSANISILKILTETTCDGVVHCGGIINCKFVKTGTNY